MAGEEKQRNKKWSPLIIYVQLYELFRYYFVYSLRPFNCAKENMNIMRWNLPEAKKVQEHFWNGYIFPYQKDLADGVTLGMRPKKKMSM